MDVFFPTSFISRSLCSSGTATPTGGSELRIYSLLELLQKENRILRKDQDASEIDLSEHVDYETADRLVAEKRSASLAFLREALSD
jgi:hypothetical protein